MHTLEYAYYELVEVCILELLSRLLVLRTNSMHSTSYYAYYELVVLVIHTSVVDLQARSIHRCTYVTYGSLILTKLRLVRTSGFKYSLTSSFVGTT